MYTCYKREKFRTCRHTRSTKKVLKKYKNDGPYKDVICTNEHCITHQETYLPKRFKEYGDMLVCEYCENSTRK